MTREVWLSKKQKFIITQCGWGEQPHLSFWLYAAVVSKDVGVPLGISNVWHSNHCSKPESKTEMLKELM